MSDTPKHGCEWSSLAEARLLVELFRGEIQRLQSERDEARAAVVTLREALELAAPHHQGFHSKVGLAIRAALAATAAVLP